MTDDRTPRPGDAEEPTDVDAAADAALMADLGHALAAFDPVPERARLAAHGLLSWRTLDDELAELTFDSALDAAGVRGLAWPRQLSFEAADSSIEVEIDGRGIVGQVVPPASVDVTLSRATGEARTTRSDAVGHFEFDDVEAGAVRLRAVLPDGTITTQWFSL